jgi:hypothetical protein
MDARDLLTVVLHLDPVSEPLRGRVEIGDEAIEFTGWVGLAGALDRALTSAAHGRVPPEPAP